MFKLNTITTQTKIWKLYTILSLFVLMLATIIFALNTPQKYKSDATIVPHNKSASSYGSLGGLATFVGVSVGSSSSMSLANSFGIFLNDASFMEEFITKYKLTDKLLYPDTSSYRFAFGYRGVFDMFGSSSDIALKEIQEDRLYKAHQKLKKMISISEDKKSGMISVSVIDPNTHLAKEILEKFIKAISEHLKKLDFDEIDKSISYYTKELQKTQDISLKQQLSKQLSALQQRKVIEPSGEYYKFSLILQPSLPFYKDMVKPEPSTIVVGSVVVFVLLVLGVLVFGDKLRNSLNKNLKNLERFKENTLYIYLLFILALTSSFDIFMNISIAGFSFRMFYIVELFIIFLIFKNIIKGNQKKVILIGYIFILIWAVFIVAFIPQTTILTRSIGYVAWLLLSIAIVIIFSTLVNKEELFNRLFKLYIFSFVLLALFGLLQFSVGILGIELYTRQWWIKGVLARINGFSYEPSYYGSYLIIGWSLLLYLYINNKQYFQQYKYYFLIISIAIVLSSSRMAILVMTIGFFSLVLFSFFKSLTKYKTKKRDFRILIIFILVLTGIGIFIYNNFETVKFLFAGLGIFGTSAHSSGTRTKEAWDTFEVFLNSPFIGHSLGGVAPAIAELRGTTIYTQLEAKNFEGMNIFLEVLAASGIIGFTFFILFFTTLYYKAFKTINQLKNITNRHYVIISSLAFALFMELFILSMNQNILRPYLWVLIGMFSASILVGRKIVYENNNRL